MGKQSMTGMLKKKGYQELIKESQPGRRQRESGCNRLSDQETCTGYLKMDSHFSPLFNLKKEGFFFPLPFLKSTNGDFSWRFLKPHSHYVYERTCCKLKYPHSHYVHERICCKLKKTSTLPSITFFLTFYRVISDLVLWAKSTYLGGKKKPSFKKKNWIPIF